MRGRALLFALLLAGAAGAQPSKCVPAPLAAPSVRHGVLPGNCRLRDFPPLARSRWGKGMDPDTALDLYAVNTTLSGMLGVEAASVKLDLFLAVLDGDKPVLFDDNGGGGPSGLDPRIAPFHGKAETRYLIVAGSALGAGDYQLTVSFQSETPECPSFSLELNQTVTRDFVPCRGDAAPGHRYMVRVPRTGRLTVRSNAPVSVQDAKGQAVGGRLTAPGEYSVFVHPAAAGTYHLVARLAADCPATPLKANEGLWQPVNGGLAESSCRVADLPVEFDVSSWGQYYVQRYSFSTDRAGSFQAPVSLPLRSVVVCGGKVAPARVPAGACELWVMSPKPAAYTLRPAFLPDCISRSLPLNAAMQATLSMASCRESGDESGVGRIEKYKMAVPHRGALRLTVSASSFKPRLRWQNTVQPLPFESEVAAGEYEFAILAPPAVLGAYQVEAKFSCPAAVLSPGHWADGDVFPDDCRPSDVWKSREERPMRRFSISTVQQTAAVFEVTATRRDAALSLYDAAGTSLGEAPVLNGKANLPRTLSKGTYYVAVKGQSGGQPLHFRLQMQPMEQGRGSTLPVSPHPTEFPPDHPYTLVVSSRGNLVADGGRLFTLPGGRIAIAYTLHYEGAPLAASSIVRIEWKVGGQLADVQEFQGGAPQFDRIFTYGNPTEAGEYVVTVTVDGDQVARHSFRVLNTSGEAPRI